MTTDPESPLYTPEAEKPPAAAPLTDEQKAALQNSLGVGRRRAGSAGVRRTVTGSRPARHASDFTPETAQT